jgi:hypothetical protein
MARSVTSTALSPFSQQRYELETRHVYFLPPTLLGRLEAPRPTYLVGTRGTGKTTLLKAMSAKERLHNESLRRQLGGRPFETRYVGVYFKLPDTQMRALDGWLNSVDDDVYEGLMALYLDTIILELLTESVAELIAEGVIATSPEREGELLNQGVLLYRDSGFLEDFMPPPQEMTTRSLCNAFRALRRYLEGYARRRLPHGELVDRFPLQAAGKLVRDLSPCLADVCSADDGEPWRFYACMDEGENITDRQQRIVNTVVRLAAAPTYPIVAYVRAPSEVSFIPSDRLTRADRELLRIDGLPAKQFRQLVEGISSVRLQAALDREDASFSVGSILGDSRLDDLLLGVLTKSEAPRARVLLDEARRRPLPSRKSARAKAPPIIETYLRMGANGGEQLNERWQQRRDASAHRRKKIVAAYLSICHELHATPRYASAAIMLQLCDVCVRDFLWQMDEIFRASRLSVEDFTETRISDDVQDAALHRASVSKFDRADEALIEAPEPAKRLILALGKITAAAQSWSSDGAHLRSPERGIFVVRPLHENDPGEKLPLIREAVESGYLQFTRGSTPAEWRFRLHTSLAPRFGSSYRGAYYPILLTTRELNRLCYTEDPAQLDSAIQETIRRIQGVTDDSVELPLGDS